MVLPSLSSPDRKSQNTFFSSSPSKKLSGRDELGSWSTVLERHRFLLTMMALLAFLCSIYLYFAVTLGASDPCSEKSGAEKALCSGVSKLKREGANSLSWQQNLLSDTGTWVQIYHRSGFQIPFLPY